MPFILIRTIGGRAGAAKPIAVRANPRIQEALRAELSLADLTGPKPKSLLPQLALDRDEPGIQPNLQQNSNSPNSRNSRTTWTPHCQMQACYHYKTSYFCFLSPACR